jgi:hypothetical protein
MGERSFDGSDEDSRQETELRRFSTMPRSPQITISVY